MRHDRVGCAQRCAPAQHVDLEVGTVKARIAAHEGAGADARAGERPVAEEHVARPGGEAAREAERKVVGGHRPGAAEADIGVEMVAETGADAGQVPHRLDAHFGEMLGRADAGELEQVGRAERAAGDDDFAPRPRPLGPRQRLVFDARRAAVLDQQAARLGGGLDVQVRPLFRRSQVRLRGAPAPLARAGELVEAGALLLRPVEIRIGGDTGLDSGVYHGAVQLPFGRHVRDAERTARAVQHIPAAFIVFRLDEVRQHRIPVPALQPALAPAVIVAGLAAHVDHAVDGAAAAEHAAARLEEPAPVQRLDGLGLELPVDPRVGEQLGEAEGNVDPGVGVARPRLQQQHGIAPGLAQPRGDGASGRARAGHDKVELGIVRQHCACP